MFCRLMKIIAFKRQVFPFFFFSVSTQWTNESHDAHLVKFFQGIWIHKNDTLFMAKWEEVLNFS